MNVLVIDNYDSFVYNLVQYVGKLGAEPVVYRNDAIHLEEALKLNVDRIIISPGPGTPEDERCFGVCKKILQNMSHEIPTLGVCLGHQGIIFTFGGKIVRANTLVHGKTSFIKHDGQGIFKGVSNPLEGTRYPSLVGDRENMPSCLQITAESIEDHEIHEIMGVRHVKYPKEEIQCDPESILTTEGEKIIRNFLRGT